MAAALMLLVPPAEAARERGARIDSPDALDPLRVEPGERMDLWVRLRQPLTPPPGVQQIGVWDGWFVGLRRTVDLAVQGAERTVEYRLRPLRVRPAGGDRYRMTAVAPPWVLAGTYDLLLGGPGVEASSPGALVIAGGEEDGVFLDVTLPPGPSGVSAFVDGAPLVPSAVSLAGFGSGAAGAEGRVVRFAVPGAGDAGLGPVADRVALRPVAGRSCHARVALRSDDSVAYEGDPGAVAVIWEIGDWATAAGREARLTPALDDGVTIRATGLDGYGRPCRAEQRVPGHAPRAVGGCGCLAGASGGDGLFVVLARFFFLFRSETWEYDAGRDSLLRGTCLER